MRMTLYESAGSDDEAEVVDWLSAATRPVAVRAGSVPADEVSADRGHAGTGEAVDDEAGNHDQVSEASGETFSASAEAMACEGCGMPSVDDRVGLNEVVDETRTAHTVDDLPVPAQSSPPIRLRGSVVAAGMSGGAGALASRADQLEGLRAIEDRLLAKSLVTTEASLAWADIDLEDLEGSKAKFVAEFGADEGMKRYRIALASWSTAKHAPVGLKNSIAVTLGALKAKSGRETAPQSLNMTFVQITAPQAEIMDAITVGEND